MRNRSQGMGAVQRFGKYNGDFSTKNCHICPMFLVQVELLKALRIKAEFRDLNINPSFADELVNRLGLLMVHGTTHGISDIKQCRRLAQNSMQQ